MSLINTNNLFNKKNDIITKNVTITSSDKQLFLKALNKEKKYLENRVKNKEEHNFKSNKDKITTKEMCTLPSKKKVQISSKDNEDISVDKTKLEEEELEINMDKSGSEDNKKHEILNDILLLLQNLHNIIQTDSSQAEQVNEINIDLNTLQIGDLSNVKNELTMLLENLDVQVNSLITDNIKAVLTDLDKILKNNEILMAKEDINEVLNKIEDLEGEIRSILKEYDLSKTDKLNTGKIQDNSESINMKESEVPKEEQSSKGVDNRSELDNAKIKNLDKSSKADSSKSQDFINQNKGQDTAISNENLLISSHEIFDQKIELDVIKNEIVNPKQFINDIAQKTSLFLSKDRNEMSIQLTPENLGKISIKIGLNDGSLEGKIYAENYSVKEIIESNLNNLRNALEEKGLSIGGLEVHIGDDSKNFDKSPFKSNLRNSKGSKRISGISNGTFNSLEQELDLKNPYLISGQFDGLA